MRTVVWVSCLIVETSALLGGRFRCFEVFRAYRPALSPSFHYHTLVTVKTYQVLLQVRYVLGGDAHLLNPLYLDLTVIRRDGWQRLSEIIRRYILLKSSLNRK